MSLYRICSRQARDRDSKETCSWRQNIVNSWDIELFGKVKDEQVLYDLDTNRLNARTFISILLNHVVQKSNSESFKLDVMSNQKCELFKSNCSLEQTISRDLKPSQNSNRKQQGFENFQLNRPYPLIVIGEIQGSKTRCHLKKHLP